MTKTYGLKALRALIPMATEAPPLLASYDPFGNGTQPWIVRYIVDSKGFWLQLNDQYGQVGGSKSPLEPHETEGLTGFNRDDLEASSLDGVGYRWGLPGGAPLLPLQFTAKQFLDFNTRCNNLFAGAMERPAKFRKLSAKEVNKVFDMGPPVKDSAAWEPKKRDLKAEWIAELQKTNQEAAELARVILDGVFPMNAGLDSAKACAAVAATAASEEPEPQPQSLPTTGAIQPAALNAQLKAPYTAPPAADTASRERSEKAGPAGRNIPAWVDKAAPYIAKVLREGRHATAKDLHTALFNKAGIDDSPFQKGSGVKRDNIVFGDGLSSISLKRFQNLWTQIKTAAKKV